MNALGTELLLELKDCNRELLNDLDYVKETLLKAALEAGATIVGDTFHQFQPRGVTGIVLLAESHLCIHTWPEYSFAAVDIFTCGDTVDPQKAAHYLIQRLQSAEPSVTELKRGMLAIPVTSSQG
ncbi:MAG: adenosylmethionine decarboxylase [Dehalococcoidia bacterium]